MGLVLRILLTLVVLAAPSAAWATGLTNQGPGSGGGGGSAGFDAITTGSNTTATMTCGTGCSITTSGSGTNAATTAAALAANGTNCSAGQAPLGVDAAGNAESCTAYAPVGASYITETADSSLTAEFAMGSLGTGLVVNTTTTGVPSIYAGSGTCGASTWFTALSAAGAKTCTQPAFSDISSTATAAQTPLATLLAGRAGAGNDTTLSTSVDGSLYGSTTTAKNLILRANSANTTTGVIQLDAPQVNLYSDFPAAPTTTVTLLNSSPTTTLTSGTGNYVMANAAPVITVADTTGSAYYMAAGSVERTGTSGATLYGVIGFENMTKFASGTSGGPLLTDAFVDATNATQYGIAACTANLTPRACCTGSGTGTCTDATQNTWVPISFQSAPTIAASGNAAFTLGRATALYSRWQITSEKNAQCTANVLPYTCCTGSGTGTCGTTSAATVTRAEGVHMVNPVLTGSALVTNVVGISIDSLTSGGSQNTSLESLGTTTDMRHAGPAIFGATGPPAANYDLDVEGDALVKLHMDLGDDIADLAGSATTQILDVQPTVDMSGATSNTLEGIIFAPVTNQSGSGVSSSTVVGLEVSPALTLSGAGTFIPVLSGLKVGGTSTTTGAGAIPSMAIVNHSRVYTSATASTALGSVNTVSDSGTMSSTATSGTNTGDYTTILHNPSFIDNGASGALTISADTGLTMQGTYTQTAGTLVGTIRRGLWVKAPTDTSSVLVSNIAVDVDATTKGSTERTALRSAIVANAAAFFLHDTGGAQSSLKGVISTYNNVAKDASHNGMPFTIASATTTGNTANIAAVDIVASGSVTAGRYRVCGYAAITTAASVSSTLPFFNMVCTDPTDSVAKTIVLSAINIGNTTGTASSGCGICDAKVSTAIRYSTSGYVSSAAGMAYKTYVTCEAL